jgi:hypothetical protein
MEVPFTISTLFDEFTINVNTAKPISDYLDQIRDHFKTETKTDIGFVHCGKHVDPMTLWSDVSEHRLLAYIKPKIGIDIRTLSSTADRFFEVEPHKTPNDYVDEFRCQLSLPDGEMKFIHQGKVLDGTKPWGRLDWTTSRVLVFIMPNKQKLCAQMSDGSFSSMWCTCEPIDN